MPASLISSLGPHFGLIAFLALVALVVGYVRQARHLNEIKQLIGLESIPSMPREDEIRVRKLPANARSRPALSPKVMYAVAGVAILTGLAVGVASLVSGGEGPTNSGPARTQASVVTPPASKVDPASITVAVLNGTSTAGLAAQAAQALQGAGFVIGTTTNAAVSDVQRSQVMRVAGQEAAAKTVARQLGISEIVDADSVSKTIAGSAEVIVLVGTDRQ